MLNENRVELIGLLGDAPKINNSKTMFALRICTNYNNVATWHYVKCFNIKLYQTMQSKNVTKGDKIRVIAHLSNSKYEKDGVVHYTTNIIANKISWDKKIKDAASLSNYRENDTYLSLDEFMNQNLK